MNSQLENIIALTELNYEFFDLWDKLIRMLISEEMEKISSNIIDIAKLLYSNITKRPIVEDDIIMDPILAGSLLMLDTLDELFKPILKESVPKIYSSDFLHFLLSKGLFSREKYDDENPEISYPL